MAPMESNEGSKAYEVLARRFRPENFASLLGQAGLAKALQNAIGQQRVGHAYLFTGARGVGKTSTARIFAKALNCTFAEANEPCCKCDLCQSIATGSDIDVLEIDGASNRGIDEIRQLRSSVSVRPSRSQYKIYIIDEVHMLTTAAFNALLKTLEEPPAHVKFVFCTTDPEKIPITVLSRCQRFDFAPVTTDEIADRLKWILEQESVEADDQALRLVARRAAGSVRDSQSLLEQLISFSTGRITVDRVHELLGTVSGGHLVSLISQIERHNPSAALGTLDQAIQEGADVGQLGEQLLGVLRDSMALLVGCAAENAVHSDPSDANALLSFGQSVGLETILAMAQIVDQSLTRMRQSTEPRILMEVALVRLCQMEKLTDLSALIEQVSTLQPVPNATTEQTVQPATAKPTPVRESSNPRPSSTASPSAKPPSSAAPTHAAASPAAETSAEAEPISTDSEEPTPHANDSTATEPPSIGKQVPEIAEAAPRNQAGTSTTDSGDSTSVSSSASSATPGDTGAQDAGAQDTGAQDTRAQDTGAQDTGSRDTGAQDTGSRDTGSRDANLKKNDSRTGHGSPGSPSQGVAPQTGDLNELGSPRELWSQIVSQLEDTTADLAAAASSLAISGPNKLVVTLNSSYNMEMCNRPERRARIESVASDVAGRKILVEFRFEASERRVDEGGPPRKMTAQQRRRQVERHPLVDDAAEILDAHIDDVRLPRSNKPTD